MVFEAVDLREKSWCLQPRHGNPADYLSSTNEGPIRDDDSAQFDPGKSRLALLLGSDWFRDVPYGTNEPKILLMTDYRKSRYIYYRS